MAPGQTGIIRKKRRNRGRRFPALPFILLALLGAGILWGARLLVRSRPRPKLAAGIPAGYVVDSSALQTEYAQYYGKPIEDSAIESRFRQAAQLMSGRNYPDTASVLEGLSRTAAVPVVFNDLGVVYYALGDYAHAAEAFREALARDADYSPSRQFLRNSAIAIPANSADPFTREAEPNNEARTSNLIAMGVAADGEISGTGNDVDYFRVITPAAPRDILSIELANHSIQFAPRLHVYDDNLRLLSWGEKTAGVGESIKVSGGSPPNSPLYISVSAADGGSGQYVLSVKALKAYDRFEPDDDILSSHRITTGEDVEANIMDAGDTDFYSFQSPRTGTVTIDIRNRSETLIPGVTVFNTDRHNIGFGPEVRKPGVGLHHTIDVERDRTYYIQVWPQAGSSGAYSLRVE